MSQTFQIMNETKKKKTHTILFLVINYNIVIKVSDQMRDERD